MILDIRLTRRIDRYRRRYLRSLRKRWRTSHFVFSHDPPVFRDRGRWDILASDLQPVDGIEPSAAEGCGFFEYSFRRLRSMLAEGIPLGRLWLPDNTLCRLTIAVRIRLGHRLIDAAHGNRFGARRPCLGGIRSLDAMAFLADAGFGKNASLEDEAADARAKSTPPRSSRCDILASGLPQMDGIEPSVPEGCGFFEYPLRRLRSMLAEEVLIGQI